MSGFVWGKVYPSVPHSHDAVAVPAAVSTDAAVADAVVTGCAAGYRHSVLVTSSGAVLTFGSNIEGQLGRTGA
jgi:alpha-tubulin suppressor-like RCC1 family protein